MSPPLIIMAEMRNSPSHISVLHTIGEDGVDGVMGGGPTLSGSSDTLWVNVYWEEGSLLKLWDACVATARVVSASNRFDNMLMHFKDTWISDVPVHL